MVLSTVGAEKYAMAVVSQMLNLDSFEDAVTQRAREAAINPPPTCSPQQYSSTGPRRLHSCTTSPKERPNRVTSLPGHGRKKDTVITRRRAGVGRENVQKRSTHARAHCAQGTTLPPSRKLFVGSGCHVTTVLLWWLGDFPRFGHLLHAAARHKLLAVLAQVYRSHAGACGSGRVFSAYGPGYAECGILLFHTRIRGS